MFIAEFLQKWLSLDIMIMVGSTKSSFLSVKETAALLDVSEKTVYRWLSAGTIPHSKVGEQYRFSREDIISWGQSTGRRIPPEFLYERGNAEIELPDLSDSVKSGGIYFQVSGSSKSEIINEAVSIMRLPQNGDRKYIYDSLLARESLASTGIGNGIAVPHLRYALQEIEQSQVTICLLADPVDWNAIDGKPVDIIFIPICPDMKCHLHLLSQISFAVQNSDWLQILRSRTTRKEIIESLDEIKKEIFK